MDVGAIAGTSSVANAAANAASTGSAASADKQTLVGNYEMFLELLTIQIKNQNPLEPMDANQFTEQLTQYSSVEQQIKTNENLEQMIKELSSQNMGAIVSYIGKEVEASGSTAVLRNGSATWTYDSDRAATAAITVTNSAGAVVYSQQQAINAGSGSFTWDGKAMNGGTAPDGEYTINIAATDANGAAATVTTGITGVVDEVDLSGGEAVLKIGNVRVPIGSVTAIRESSIF